MTSQVGVLGAESYLILSGNYHSPLLHVQQNKQDHRKVPLNSLHLKAHI